VPGKPIFILRPNRPPVPFAPKAPELVKFECDEPNHPDHQEQNATFPHECLRLQVVTEHLNLFSPALKKAYLGCQPGTRIGFQILSGLSTSTKQTTQPSPTCPPTRKAGRFSVFGPRDSDIHVTQISPENGSLRQDDMRNLQNGISHLEKS
jgi:hypothetical protein